MPKACRILKLHSDEDIARDNIIYYYNLGCRTQYIMLQDYSNELIEILVKIQKEKPAINLNLLFADREGKGFNPCNEDFLKILVDRAIKDGFNWIVGSDVDEFLVLKRHNTIEEFIEQYDNQEVVSLIFDWVNYYIDREDEKFYNRMQRRKSGVMGWTKSIGKFDKSMYFVQGLHHIGNADNGTVEKPLEEKRIDVKDAFFAHYPFRSRTQYALKHERQAMKFGGWRQRELDADAKHFYKKFDWLNEGYKWIENVDERQGIKDTYLNEMPLNLDLLK